MKKILSILLSVLLAATAIAQNCGTGPNGITPGVFNTPGFNPPTSALPCITQGIYVHDTIYFTCYSTLSGVTIDSLTFDTIANLPSGLCWTSNKANNTFRAGENGVFYISGTTTAAPGQYALSMTGHTSTTAYQSLNISLDGAYFLRLIGTSDTCTVIDSLAGTINSFIPYGTTLNVNVTANGSLTFCQGGSVTLMAYSSEGNDYLWSDGETTQSIVVTTTGTYSVRAYYGADSAVSNAVSVVVGSCSGSGGQPGLYPASSLVPCIVDGQYVHDTITFVNYSTVSGLLLDSLTLDTIFNIPAGLTWTTNMPNNDFLGADTGYIYISGYTSALPGQYALNIYATLYAQGAPVISDASLEQVTGLYYYLRVSCGTGSCMMVDTLNGRNNPFIADSTCGAPLSVHIDESGPTPYCNGGSVTLTAVSNDGNVTFLWSDNETSASIVVTTTGYYTVTVTTDSGASAIATQYVFINTPPTALFTLQPTATPHVWNIVNECTSSDGLLEYMWQWGDGDTISTDSPAISHTYSSAGYYTICVTVEDSAGCFASFCDSDAYLFKNQSGQIIQVDVVQGPLGINTISINQEDISYYGGAVHLSQPITAPAAIRLYDLSGREVMAQDGFTGSVLQLNGSIAQGVYIIHLQNMNYSLSKKLTILQ